MGSVRMVIISKLIYFNSRIIILSQIFDNTRLRLRPSDTLDVFVQITR